MNQPDIYLHDWSGRAFSLETGEDFRAFVQNPRPIEFNTEYLCACPSVPPRVRGKSSPLSRMIMAPFFEVMSRNQRNPATVDVVFASQFGEIRVLESLLNAIYSRDAISPLDFCNSVHHTPTGYLSIAARNQGISRTVSAGDCTFGAALLETWQLLTTGRSQLVALLIGDESVPDFFIPGEKHEFAFGMALLFGIEKQKQNVDEQLVLFSDIYKTSCQPVTACDWLRNRYCANGEK
jgi:hypothetical protein